MGMLRQALTGEYDPHGQESDAKVILAFAFGRGNGVPGAANEALAEFAVKQAEQHSIAIIAQLAVADAVEQILRDRQLERRRIEAALDQQVVAPQPGYGTQFVRVDPRTKKEAHYMDSRHFLLRAKRLIEPGTVVMPVAQAYHAPRADRMTERLGGFPTVLPPGLPDVWDPGAIHQERHCRSALAWAKREPFVIAHHWAARWI